MTDSSPMRVLMLATNGFAELLESRHALLEAGIEVTLASITKESIQGVVYDDTSRSMSRTSVIPDVILSEVDISKFDALVLSGGVASPDTLRMTTEAIDIVRGFVSEGKWVAAICHAPWLLVEAGAMAGPRATGWYSIRTDLANAGATVVDEEVVVDGHIITSRMPSDIPSVQPRRRRAVAERLRR